MRAVHATAFSLTWFRALCHHVVVLLTAGLVTQPLLGAARADHPTRYSEVTSPGGIVFHHRFDDITPYASVSFGWPVSGDQRGREGLRALLPALLFNGVYPKTPHEYYEQLADLHASTTLSIGDTQVIADAKAPAGQIEPALDLLLRALRRGMPNANTFRRARSNAIAADAQGTTRAETQVARSAALWLLGDHVITRSFDPKRFDTLRLADVVAWRRTAFDDGPLSIVVSGRIERVAAAALVDRAFASWPRRPAAKRPAVALVDARATSIRVPVTGRQSVIRLEAPTRVIEGREGRIAVLAHAVFGSGPSSRVWTVRGDLGATYGASSSLGALSRTQRNLVISAAVDPAQTEGSVIALKRAYATWYDQGITDAELRAQRERMITAFATSFRDPSAANRQLLQLLVTDRPAADLEEFVHGLTALTRADVNDFIKARFPKPDELLLVVGTPEGTSYPTACAINSFAEVRTACAARAQ